MESQDDNTIIPISEWPVTDTPRNVLVTQSGITANSNTTAESPDWIDNKRNVNKPWEHTPKNRLILSQRRTPVSREPMCKKSKSEHVGSTEFHLDIESAYDNLDNEDSCKVPGGCELLADARVARWWRRYPHRYTESLPVTSNPQTLLFHISRTAACKSYLQEEKRKLQQKSSQILSQDRSDIHAAIASIDDWLGNYRLALDGISKAVELDQSIFHWLVVVLSEDAKYRWLKAKLEQQCKMIDTQNRKMALINMVPKLFPSTVEVERISAKDIGTDEFVECFLNQRKPVILLDAVKDMTTSSWDLDFIKSVAGQVKATVKHSVPVSVEWAKLEPSRETTVGEFIDQVKGAQTKDYLFDWSLPIHCPQLARDLFIPKYFSGNLLQKTLPGSLYHDSWPSLFIAPKEAVSSLHIDAFASHFWMALFQGEKRWTFFEADDAPLLYPEYFHSMDPVFSVDLSHPDVEKWPLLALTKPRHCVLQPGELLFVPAGSPHYVENLSNSVAVSANYVDESNLKQVCEELRINALLDPRAADLLQQHEHPQFMENFVKKKKNSLKHI